MKGEKEQPDFIAEAFKMKIISAFPPANEQMIIHVLNLIYDWYERFISFRLCNNNPPGISILKIISQFLLLQTEGIFAKYTNDASGNGVILSSLSF